MRENKTSTYVQYKSNGKTNFKKQKQKKIFKKKTGVPVRSYFLVSAAFLKNGSKKIA